MTPPAAGWRTRSAWRPSSSFGEVRQELVAAGAVAGRGGVGAEDGCGSAEPLPLTPLLLPLACGRPFCGGCPC
ncbi:hypothetical protein QFZ49_002872 [Streptomyces turgidiscabies]|uniref:Uncharacterized protein n=1 Tax=Streptomyces turgidiscabies TaxID=85558 RepID=A0ABU0RP68_9ACTN|nr:hypothetical protein [Streptomyces turgidiscabies]